MIRAAVAIVLIALATLAHAQSGSSSQPDGHELLERLYATDRASLEQAVAAIERAGAQTPALADALFKAARVCEENLADPARALALYERILRDYPHVGGLAGGARRSAEALRSRLGTGDQFATEAAELARLRADADRMPPAEVERRLVELGKVAWPGAPMSTMFLADWLLRTGRPDQAQARYAEVAARWPRTSHAHAAVIGGAQTALQRHDWDLAELLASQFSTTESHDLVLREEVLAKAAIGRTRDHWYVISWLALAVSLAALLASLAESMFRGGRQWPSMRPPIEVMFLFPVAAVLVGVALTTHQLIAPAVLALSIGGLVLTWLSGITLEILRIRRRPIALRAVLHVALSIVAVVALLYIVLMSNNLLEMMIETIQFGPE